MLQALRKGNGRGPSVTGATIPSPIEGWDAVSPLSSMSPKRAIVMDNFFPREGYVELRKGRVQWATTGETTPVETVMAYQAANPTSDRLFAITNGKVFNVTASGAAGAAVVTGLSNSRCQYVNFTTSGGHFLYMVNGANAARYYDGTSWTTPTITSATSSDFIGINAFKNRLFFMANNKLGFYYLPIDSIAGAASFYELGGIFTQGGYLMAMGTWTVDGGQGVDDHAIFISSRGQVAIFTGNDPSNASAWSLVGVFDGPAPIGRRCLRKVGGDNVIVSVEGVIPLSKSLILDKAALRNVSITANISSAMNDAARSYGANFGWQIIGYAKGTMAVLNVPIAEGHTQYQYVMNTLSGAWARFKGWNANCWEVFNDDLYFGGNDGSVSLADTGPNDNGADIVADLKTAFNYFGMRGTLKRWPMIQPVIRTDGRVNPGIIVNTDFRDKAPVVTARTNTSSRLRWGHFKWDQATWPQDVTVSVLWKSVAAIGQCASVSMRIVANGTSSSSIVLQVNAFNLTMERGGIL